VTAWLLVSISYLIITLLSIAWTLSASVVGLWVGVRVWQATRHRHLTPWLIVHEYVPSTVAI